MLNLSNIKKSYKTGTFLQHALKGVSINFRKSEFVSILGASGSGKTTLLNIIGGLDRYDSGDLIINKKSTKKFKDSDWDAYRNNSIGFVFQSYNLISHISVLENVEMGMTLSGVSLSKRRKKALEVLDKVGLKEHSHKKPNQLSGGQMQRVAIARALANNPEIVLADEPTGALDSTTSIQIMELIKEIAKDKLVIMVTHNSTLAKQYSNRIIQIKDGEIVDDTNPVSLVDKDGNYKIRKTSMSFLTALKLSLNNIFTKKGRTILTAFASSIGIIGIALILSLSNGFDKQIKNFEQNTLASFPIMINQQAMEVDSSRFERVREQENQFPLFPDKEEIIGFNRDELRSIHRNIITKEYKDYIEQLDSSKIVGISYTRGTNLNLLIKNDEIIKQVSYRDLSFSSLPVNYEEGNFISSNFDLLAGSLPTKENEILLEIDSRNRLDINIIETLELSDLTSYKNLIGYELTLVFNNDYYNKISNTYTIGDLDLIYNNKNNLKLKVVGIIRPQDGSVFAEDRGRTGGFYHMDELVSSVIDKNSNSNIVKDQLNSDVNLLTGQPLTDKTDILNFLGYEDLPIMINIYPKDFESKEYITDYLDEYNNDKENADKIIYTDLAATISSLSGNIMSAITIVLISFSAISLVVSSIMIGIITYISVIERTKEIGILRALGARKKDITRVFNAETFIIGLSSGILGIVITRLLIIPTNIVLYNITELKNVAQMNFVHISSLLLVSIILTLIGGFIPAKMASKKDPVEALRTE
jgi:putative ABC transport system permease protein